MEVEVLEQVRHQQDWQGVERVLCEDMLEAGLSPDERTADAVLVHTRSVAPRRSVDDKLIGPAEEKAGVHSYVRKFLDMMVHVPDNIKDGC